MAGSEWIDWLDASFIKRGIFPRSDVGILERLYKDWDGAEEGNAFLFCQDRLGTHIGKG
jgi:hypothetical protein